MIGIRRDMILAVFFHLMIIPAAFLVNGGVTPQSAPAAFMKIFFSDDVKETGYISTGRRKKNTEGPANGMFSDSTDKGYPEGRHDTIQKRLSPDMPLNNNPVHFSQGRSKVAPFASDPTKGESKGDLYQEQNSASLSGKNSLPSLSSASTEAGENLSGHEQQPAKISASDIISIIRSSIDKAKHYPQIAKRSGIEGTVIAEFSINSRGMPEEIKITKSSGSGILDSAARDTVIKASPFPFIAKKIAIPITFRLKEK